MNQELGKTILYMEKEMRLCPWLKSIDSKEMIRRLKMEIRELEKARTKKEIMDEAGDVALTAMKLVFMISRDHKISKKKIIRNYHEKMKRRKPFVLQGRKIGLKECMRIWAEAKRNEKRGKGRNK
jgi:uncharacterized protein YabN with tetrapyrrole methylase and pyrophosphatase domain